MRASAGETGSMAKELFVTSTPHETKLAIVEDDKVTEVYFERENEYTLAGSIYKGKVTRVLPGMQSAFVEVGLERDAFLYVTDFLEEVGEDTEDLDTVTPSAGRQQAAGEEAAEGSEREARGERPQPAEGSEGRGGRRWGGRRRRRGRGPRGPENGGTPAPAAESSAAPSAEGGIEISGDFTEEASPLQSQSEEFVAPVEERAAPEPERPRREPRPVERVVLPGESLAKYGRPAEETSAASKPSAPAVTSFRRPSTEVTDPSAFFAAGGVMAGESLSKYKNRPPEPAPVMESRAEEHESHVAVAPVAEPEPAVEPLPIEDEQVEIEEVVEAAPEPVAAREPEPTPVAREHEDAPKAVEPVAAEASAEPGHFSPGEGVIEEEVITEEEHEPEPVQERVEMAALDELEEETLDYEEQREAQVIAAAQSAAQAAVESGADLETLAPVEPVEEEDFEEVDEDEVLGALDTPVGDPEHPEFEGSAEVREPAGTAGLVQRAPRRPERRRGGDRDRDQQRGRGRRMRRRNIVRGPLPQINELLKEGQEILVQIAKEPIAKKGARITSHIALPGRFLVYMPTVGHTGVSRKIGSEEERRRLKRVLLSEKGEAQGGFIVRTAASGASEDDLRADIRFLINLWKEIRQRSEASNAPALIYHDLNLVERILRDQVTENFSQIWVDTEAEYERILRFAQRFQPSLVKRVKLYDKDVPLFEEFGVADEINKALKSKVWLKSGGYIVINQTEALVAIDINTGKYVGKTTRLEDTIVKTNLDAIQEIVRQIRLRDLGGIIVIDFIDMDERKNRHKVLAALEEALKSDRSPSKVLQFNDFGLVAITRKRVKQSLERTLGTQCPYCTGTGMVKSVATVCNEIYVEMRKMKRTLENHQVMLRVNPEVAKALKENNARWLTEMEELLGKTIIVKSDPQQHQEQFDIH